MPGTPSTRRGNRKPVVADNPDVVRDISQLADDLDNAPAFDFGTAAVRAGIATPYEGYIFWTTDDLTMGPQGSPYVWRGGAWRLWSHPNDPAAGTAGARTLGAGATQAAPGNDARLSDARTPLAHAASHRAGGTDEVSKLVANALQVKWTGQLNQLRAGRVFTLADFTTLLGRSTPVGLYNLGDLTDISGNARTLTNKGAVTFGGLGIAGQANVGIFPGSATSALYRADVGAGDTFRIRHGSWGGWFKSGKRGATQALVSKWGVTAGLQDWYLQITSSNNSLQAGFATDAVGTQVTAIGQIDVVDDRWHFAVAVADGSTLKLYIDGVLETLTLYNGVINNGAGPFNLGSISADAANPPVNPLFGRMDEAFVTTDALDADDIRLLYAAKLAHGYAVTPRSADTQVKRRKRGAPLTTGDFPATPLRLYNLNPLNTTDLGSQNISLAANGTIFTPPGPDGSPQGAIQNDGTNTSFFNATDAGLPTGAAAFAFGCWMKFPSILNAGGGASAVFWGASNGFRISASKTAAGTDVTVGATQAGSSVHPNDGGWHHCVAVYDPAALDGLTAKFYLDGAMVSSGTAVITVAANVGAGGLQIAGPDSVATGRANTVSRVFILNQAMTAEQVMVVYSKSSIVMPASPKNSGDHIEAMDATNLYVIADTLDPQHTIDLEVAA